LWEAYAKGREPYEDLNGIEATIFVNAGERLQRPSICPMHIYQVMLQCWHADMKKRPSFKMLANIFKTNSPIYENANLLADN
jgi:Protein tyrosine and serine/threonine kinase